MITNDELISTVEYIDHNVSDVLRLNHGKYLLNLNLTVNLQDSESEVLAATPTITISSTSNEDRQ